MRRLCWLCKAETDGDLDFKDVSPNAIHTLPEQERSHEDYCRAVGVPLPMLAAVLPPRESIVIDWQHATCLGIAPRACGSALLSLALEGKWGVVHRGRWQPKIDVLMRRAYRDFLDFASGEGLAHSQPLFKATTLGVASGKDYEPELKCKAHNAMVVCRWLAHITREDEALMGKHRATVLWGFTFMHSVFRSSPLRLNDEDIAAVQRAGRSVLSSWRALLDDATATGRFLWHMVPKIHEFQHLVKIIGITKRNPASHWVFGDESNIGLVKAMAKNIHATTLSQRALEALMLFVCFTVEGRSVALRAEVPEHDVC